MSTGERAVAAWRTERLIAAGFSESEARFLVRGGGVDIHAVLDLIDRGCPPWLAARITAPIDSELPRSR